MKNCFFLAFFACALSASIQAQTNAEKATSLYFETIKNDPQPLLLFLQNMPKGGDLHNHHGGASMAENMIHYAQGEHLCLDKKNLIATVNAQCPPANLLDNALQDTALYNAIVNAWSMRNFPIDSDHTYYFNFFPKFISNLENNSNYNQSGVTETGHDHFFNSFAKFLPILENNSGDILSEMVERAGEQHELYLELMRSPDKNAASLLGKTIRWNPDFAIMRKQLLTNKLKTIVNNISKSFNAGEITLRKNLACGTSQAKPGCRVKVRYLYRILREQPPVQVFSQLVVGFEAANKDPHIVGINMIQAEDGIIAMRDYKLHMQMVNFLHGLYPKVHIALHAGELNSALVPPEDLRFHIRDAVETAHAERIGHGVSIAYEDNADQLLKEMAKKHILVESCLTSNADILGIKGENHPLPLYLQYQVPIALSTDDEGILRTNLTEQYQIAISTYHLSYPTVKMLVRNSIAYSFLPGKSLWQDAAYHQIAPACIKDMTGSAHPSTVCSAFLKANEKASSQWELEKQFIQFESKI